MKNESDVLIIGGGAAGLTAALSASAQGARVTVLESAARIGRKLLATGNGRCNLANAGAPRYFGGRAFAGEALSRCPVEKTLSFFHRLGLETVEEDGGRIYPACGQAAAVLDVLRFALERENAAVCPEAPAKAIEKKGRVFLVKTPKGTFSAPCVVIACGGMAGGKLGHDGGPYTLLTSLGHTLVPPRPALTQLIAEKKAVQGLSGLRLPALLTLCDGSSPLEAALGEALFTDYGVSGVCAMQLSRKAGEMLQRGRKPVLYMDFSPMLGLIPRVYGRLEAKNPFQNEQRIAERLKTRERDLPREMLLLGLCPRLLREKLSGLSLSETARALAAYPVPITGVKGMENAQVTAGGVSEKEFDPETLMSRLCPNLFAAGEVLNVDGDCGGFNLQFAFSSGILAGESAAKAAHSIRRRGIGSA